MRGYLQPMNLVMKNIKYQYTIQMYQQEKEMILLRDLDAKYLKKSLSWTPIDAPNQIRIYSMISPSTFIRLPTESKKKFKRI